MSCGFLRELWNCWALTRWTCTVPCWGEVRLFEMPVLGYLGFAAFELEAFAMYHFLASLVSPGAGAAGEATP